MIHTHSLGRFDTIQNGRRLLQAGGAQLSASSTIVLRARPRRYVNTVLEMETGWPRSF